MIEPYTIRRMTCILAISCATVSCGSVSPERMARKTDAEVCAGYHDTKQGIALKDAHASYEAEILSRKLMVPEELAVANSGRIRIGMNLCQLYAAWGFPSGGEHKTTTRAGVSIQHVYKNIFNKYDRRYVYSENGVLSGFQN